MQFKICSNKTLCLDLRELSKEEIMLIISTVTATCEYLEEAGYKITVKAKEKSTSTKRNSYPISLK